MSRLKTLKIVFGRLVGFAKSYEKAEHITCEIVIGSESKYDLLILDVSNKDIATKKINDLLNKYE